MTKKEIELLTRAFNRYLTMKNSDEKHNSLEFPEGFNEEDKKRKMLIGVLKTHVGKMQDLMTGPYQYSSRLHRQIKEIDEFSSDLKRLLDKHDLELRTKYLIANMPDVIREKQEYYSLNDVASFFGYKSTHKVKEWITNGSLRAKDFAQLSNTKDKKYKDYRVHHDELFSHPFFKFEDSQIDDSE